MLFGDQRWYISACPVCSGALYDDALDRGWANCMMCGRSFPVEQIEESSPGRSGSGENLRGGVLHRIAAWQSAARGYKRAAGEGRESRSLLRSEPRA